MRERGGHGIGEVVVAVNAAHFLHQIRYWGDKMKIRRNGKFWIVKPAAEWQAETDLTKNQYERALSCLKDRGLVETERGRAVTYFRPIYYIGPGDQLRAAQQEEAA